MPALDGIRGVAILLVLIGHAVPRMATFAHVGVTVFFVLSGYLITGNLRREMSKTGALNLRSFYRNRAARLLPALGVMLACYLALTAGMGHAAWGRVAPAATYVQNVWAAAGHSESPLGHMWSLALEEQFYLLWPLVILVALPLWGWSRACAALLVVVLISACLRVSGLWSWEFAYFSPLTTAYALAAGCAVSGRRSRGWLPVAGATLVLAAASIPASQMVSLWAPLAGCAGACLLVTSRTGWLGGNVLRWFGDRSYGIYLWHFPLIFTVFGASISGRVAAEVVAIGLAALSWRYVEQPALAWAKRSRARGQAGDALGAVPAGA